MLSGGSEGKVMLLTSTKVVTYSTFLEFVCRQASVGSVEAQESIVVVAGDTKYGSTNGPRLLSSRFVASKQQHQCVLIPAKQLLPSPQTCQLDDACES